MVLYLAFAMKIYNVILKKEGFFNVPDAQADPRQILSMVLDGLEAAEYTIVDAEPDSEEAAEGLQNFLDMYPNRCLVLLTLPLPAHAIGNHPAIYRYCVEALSSGFLCLQQAEGAEKGLVHECLLRLKVEEKYADLVFEDYDVVRKILNTNG